MKRLLYLAALCLLCSAAFAPAAMAQSRGPSGADGTFNCEDFDDQGQAQEFFLRAGGPADPNGLDDDNDGIACESLPMVTDPNRPAPGTKTEDFELFKTETKTEVKTESGEQKEEVKTEVKTEPSKAEAKAGGTEAKAESKAKAEEKKAEQKKAEAKKEEKKEEKKEMPKTGGVGGASLLALGAGALLVGGGLLIRRMR